MPIKQTMKIRYVRKCGGVPISKVPPPNAGIDVPERSGGNVR